MTILVCGGSWKSVEHKKGSSQSKRLGTAVKFLHLFLF